MSYSLLIVQPFLDPTTSFLLDNLGKVQMTQVCLQICI